MPYFKKAGHLKFINVYYLDFADSEVAAAQITTPNAILLTKVS